MGRKLARYTIKLIKYDFYNNKKNISYKYRNIIKEYKYKNKYNSKYVFGMSLV